MANIGDYVNLSLVDFVRRFIASVWDDTNNAIKTGLIVEDIEIGAVEIKDGTTDTRAKVGAGTAIVETDNSQAVKDFAIGLTTDDDTQPTVVGRLKKLITLLPTSLGQKIAAQSLSVILASDIATKVQGPDADNAAIIGNPVLIGGQDSANKIQQLLVDSEGRLFVGGGVLKEIGPLSVTSATSLFASMDVSAYRQAFLHLTSPGTSCTTQIQFSNDNATWISVGVQTPSTGGAQGQSITTAGLYIVPVVARYMRVQVTVYGSGTITGTLELSPIAGYQLVQSSNSGDGQGGMAEALVGLYNGTNIDRARSNVAAILLASGARTTTQTSADQINYNGTHLHIILDITSAGTGSVTVSIEGKDANGIYRQLLVGVAETTTGTKVYKIGPGFGVLANAASADMVPRTFRVIITANNANSMTYSLAYDLAAN